MISLEEAVIARIKREGETFEILVDPYKARDMKHGAEIPLDNIVAARDIYLDSEKGKSAPNEDLEKAFGTSEFEQIAKEIIHKGEIQLTTEQRRELREQKRNKVISWLQKNSINPKDGHPHPRTRIENVIEKVGYHFDENKSVEDQAKEVLEKIRIEIPIKIETLKVAVRIPAEHAGKASNSLHAAFKVVEEEWKNDGSYIAVVKIPAGVQDKLYDKVNTLTHGKNETKIIEEKEGEMK